MYGQKQIMSCLMVVIFISIFNFYRSAIKKNKEMQKYKLANELARIQLMTTEQANRRLADELLKSHFIANSMLEFDDKCLAIHAIVFRPNYDKIRHGRYATTKSGTYERNHLVESDRLTNENGNWNSNCNCDQEQEFGITVDAGETADGDLAKKNGGGGTGKVMEKSFNESSSLVYVFVFILLILLGRAAYDISKQLKERSKIDSENELLRRYSLHDYSLMKHKRKSIKAVDQFMKKSVIAQRSLDSGTQVIMQQQTELTRRMSIAQNPQDYNNGSGMVTEPGTPQKPGKLLAGRPAPLLRRCSVPVFVNKKLSHPGIVRRPSMDSFSEDDSSPDVKRRVRMIQRH